MTCSARRALGALLLSTLLAAPAGAQAPDDAREQPSGVDEAMRTLLPEGDALDPIGTGDTASLRDVPAPPTPPEDDPHDPTRGPLPAQLEVDEGDVLTAIPGVREARHRVDLRVEGALAEATVELQLISTARAPAEARYRLPLPEGGVPVGLEACRGERCRQGTWDTSGAYDDAVRARGPEEAEAEASGEPVMPVASLERSADGEGLVLRVAPVDRSATTIVRVRWAAPVETRGGVLRLRVPARGSDLRVAPARVTLRAPGLLNPALQRAPAQEGTVVDVDPWVDVEVAGRLPRGGAPRLEAQTFPCGEARCGLVRAAAGPREAEPEDVVLLVDASPSTFGPTRGRTAPALAALLAAMAPGSRVRAVAFAGRAEVIVGDAVAPGALPFATLARANAMELGSATRFEAAWRALEPWTRRGRLHAILVGDGGLTVGPDHAAAVREAEARGLRLSVLNVADRATRPPLRALAERLGGVVAEVGPEAQRATRGRETARLEEAVMRVFAPAVGEVVIRHGRQARSLGVLRAGEALTWSGRLSGQTRGRPRSGIGLLSLRVGEAREQRARWTDEGALAAWGRALARAPLRLAAVAAEDREAPPPERCDPRGPARRVSGVSSDAAPIALAEPRSCEPEAAETSEGGAGLGRAIPEETVLGMLRQRIVPVARGCFRRDRAGRTDYSVRAVFRFRLADREVIEADVEGEISDVLRACLLQAVDTLEVPRFSGTVVVRYPLYTERVPPPPTIVLEEEVLDVVDRVAGDTPAPGLELLER
ncbi:MAG TPA: hypothetical protein RMH85_08505 [Polyangiaceae bacterium LLY-WYZ-15_(1-7)]|nr:hypothetical protein [Polyangiaceae bacterium LLY-WYZ-15_(1-7)]HJL08523.1 hypothetical protein [Polyangiaceae bacterium LLY-WYZ-15_(1-7)]HJL38135.1 hypothetical protein [Polyangiaceae bacterium LLY-WYZ-15_(1-7)]